MDVFVTGATGSIGRPAVRRLLAAGHRVRGLARDADAAGRVAATGAEPVPGSLFDATSLKAAMAGADAVLHLATRIPPARTLTRVAAWAENDRIRTEGTRNVVDAALATGARSLAYPSVVFAYADGGDAWLRAGAPLEPTPTMRSTLVSEAEVERFAASGGAGVVLRLGGLYGPYSHLTGQLLALARKGISPFLGPAGAYQATLWDDDAGAAVAMALAAPSGTYDIVDDRPMTRAELAAAIATAVGRRRVRRVPVPVARRLLGRDFVFLMRSQRVSNGAFREATGWRPEVPDAATGLARLAG